MQIRRKRTKAEAQKAKRRNRIRVDFIKREEKKRQELDKEIVALQEFSIA